MTAASVLLSLLIFSSVCFGSSLFDAENVLKFATHLYYEGEYVRSIREIRRFLKLEECCKKKLIAQKLLITCLLRIKKDSLARLEFEKTLYLCKNPSRHVREIFDIAKIFEKEGDMRGAETAYKLCSELKYDKEVSGHALLHRAKVLITMHEKEKAQRCIEDLERNGYSKVGLKLLLDAIKYEHHARRNAKLAMFLSGVLPGAGHMYSGNTLHGLSSFLINAGLITASYFSFREKSPILGSFLAYMESDFYIGGIRSAARDAVKRNEEVEKELKKKLDRLFPLEVSINFGRNLRSGCFTYRF